MEKKFVMVKSSWYINFCFFCIVFVSVNIHAQEKLGYANSNYCPTSSIFLNPASSADSWAMAQLNIIGVNAFAHNNAAFLPAFYYLDLIRNPESIMPRYLKSKTDKNAYVVLNADALAFTFSKEHWGWGFFTRARSFSQVKNIPKTLADYATAYAMGDEAVLKNEDVFNSVNVRISTQSWAEFGINTAYIFSKNRKDMWQLGGNLRYLSGLHTSQFGFLMLMGSYNDTLLVVDKLNSNLAFQDQPRWNYGEGMALDAGIVFKRMLKTVNNYYPNSTKFDCKHADYKFKASLALRDLGYIRYQPTLRAKLEGSGTYRLDRGQKLLKQQVIDSIMALFYTDNYTTSLPLNLCAQFDWNTEQYVYINATAVINLMPSFFNGPQAYNLISVTPRYERKNFEFALPIRMLGLSMPQMGMAFRVRSFSFGLEDALPLLFHNDLRGGGLYFNIACSLFDNPGCKRNSWILNACPDFIKKRL
jgi:hypothetical protein